MNGLPLLPDAEWLETNGLGGFALSTVSGRNARRYHGLLVAATTPPTGRAVLLGQARGDPRRRRGAVRALGQPLRRPPPPARRPPPPRLPLRPVPDVGVRGGGRAAEADVPPRPGRGDRRRLVGAALGARRTGPPRGPAAPRLPRPPRAARRGDARATRPSSARRAPSASTRCPGLPELRLAHDAESVAETFFWYRGLEYDLDRERGFEFTEDLFSPVSFALGPLGPPGGDARRDARRTARPPTPPPSRRPRRSAAAVSRGPGSDRRLLRLLRTAADRFVVRRGEGWTVIAGYPWFTDWGRDAMIALPGLLLATRRFDVARSVLETFARYVDRGMVPNRFPDEGTEPEYNNVDGTLWFVEAVRAYHEATRDERVPAAGLPAPRRDRRAAPARHALRHPRRRRRPPLLRGAGPAADLDGRQGRRPRRHAARGQAGRGAGALAQRAPDRRALRGRPRRRLHRGPPPRPRRPGARELRRALLGRDVRPPRRRRRPRRHARPHASAQPALRPLAPPPPRHGRARREASCGRRGAPPDALRPPEPRPRAPRLPRPLRGRPRRARRGLPPGNRLAVAPRPARRRPPRRPRELPREPPEGRRVARARSSSTSSGPGSASSRRSSTATRRTVPAAPWRRRGASARCCGRSSEPGSDGRRSAVRRRALDRGRELPSSRTRARPRASPSSCRRGTSSGARRAPSRAAPPPRASRPRGGRRRSPTRSRRRRRRGRGRRARPSARRIVSPSIQATALQAWRFVERTSRSVVATAFTPGYRCVDRVDHPEEGAPGRASRPRRPRVPRCRAPSGGLPRSRRGRRRSRRSAG